MIELYLDTADVAEVKRFNQCLPLKGVTTNPSILAKSKQGLNQTLAGMQEALGGTPRFHAQVVSTTVEGMVEEARQIHELPYDMVVKVPATETGLSAIKLMKKREFKYSPLLFTLLSKVSLRHCAALTILRLM
ncbi:Transaldolase [Vibrio parahaemolyticus]|nr:Transaldolase [Vibrio parahaemolyticus]